MGTAGGVLLFLGSLIYLYAIFAWYGSPLTGWLAAASFLGPFVAAFAIIGAITLFFKGIGMAAGKMPDDQSVMWKLIMASGMSMVIVTAGQGMLFWIALLGFLLTFVGKKTTTM